MKNLLLVLVFVLVSSGVAFAVSEDLQVPGYLRVTGISTFESHITSTGPLTLESGANGNIRLSPNGTGIIRLGATMEPTADNSSTLGTPTNKWKKLYVNSVGTATIPITQTKLTNYTVNDSNVTANSLIFVTWNNNGGEAANNLVTVFVTGKAAGSFTVQYAKSSNGNIGTALPFDYIVIN